MRKFVRFIDWVLEGFSRWSLIIILFGILLFAVSSIVLRWLGMSPSWIEPMVRHMVFLSAFLGGSLATSKRVHIKVDILTHLVDRSSSKSLKWVHQNLISLFCFVTTLVLTCSAHDFFKVEQQYGSDSFLGIHSSFLVAIIPFGMGLISLRFFNQLFLGLFEGDANADSNL